MEDAKQQLVDKLTAANNILVTVSRDPSVDQLSALLGLTLLLNKQGKHAAAVFSGQVPSTLEFLQPEDTFERNTDSLRDFIIALDKNKADKLRYKVENDVVRIFITPYKTSISQEDFDFSQGDFNVDVVVAIGVHQQEDLDEAITAHGRILHDATVASINTTPDGGLGTINWHDQSASSLSELVSSLAKQLAPDGIDQQIATALLTGIVSETDRFSNDKTSAQTMSISSTLMAAGANQQLVASKLAEPLVVQSNDDDQYNEVSASPQEPDETHHDGMIEIDHDSSDGASTDITEEVDIPNELPELPALELPAPDETLPSEAEVEPEIVDDALSNLSSLSSGSSMITEAPSMGGVLTANSIQEQLDPVTDPFSTQPADLPALLDHQDDTASLPDVTEDATAPEPEAEAQPEPAEPVLAETAPPSEPEPAPAAQPSSVMPGFTPPPPAWVPPSEDPFNLTPDGDGNPTSDPTLMQLEQSIEGAHTDPTVDVEGARDEVDKALNSIDAAAPAPQPIAALNSQQFGGDLHPTDQPPAGPAPAVDAELEPDYHSFSPPASVTPPAFTTDDQNQTQPTVIDPNAPPPVPPPIPFQFGSNPPQ